jgi:BioD-like phosphotransacetylase family protein
MVVAYLASTEAYSGKTLASVVLGRRWQDQGQNVGYFKPLGNPSARSPLADDDALFIANQLGLPAAPAQLCPVLLAPELCRADREEVRRRINTAFTAAAAGRDLLLVGGGDSAVATGAVVVEMLDARAVLVAKCASFLDLDAVLVACRALGERCVGVILNRVPHGETSLIADHIIPCLEREGLRVLGFLPEDPILRSASVRELAEATGAQFLTAPEAAEELVENFVVGAMSVESALPYFRRTPRKCVITGGDRSDVQLAALDTPTKCLILTGELRPSQTVLSRAQQLGVPLLLVKPDTLTTVAMIEDTIGAMRLREPKKAEHARQRFEEQLDLAALDAALGLT